MYDIKPPFYYFLEFVAFRVAASPSPRASSRDRNAAAQSLPAFDASLPTHTHTHTHTHNIYIYIYTHTWEKSAYSDFVGRILGRRLLKAFASSLPPCDPWD
jgi:hypothetical protein